MQRIAAIVNEETESIIASIVEANNQSVKYKLIVAEGLYRIYSEERWKDTHESLEKFVHDYFGFTIKRAQQYIRFHKTNGRVKAIATDPDTAVSESFHLTTERQARELSSIPDEKLPEVIETAQKLAGNEPVSGPMLKEARQQIVPPKQKKAKPEPS